jgi:hypothetical protein
MSSAAGGAPAPPSLRDAHPHLPPISTFSFRRTLLTQCDTVSAASPMESHCVNRVTLKRETDIGAGDEALHLQARLVEALP